MAHVDQGVGYWDREEPTWGVLVVHGIGAVKAGVTLETFLKKPIEQTMYQPIGTSELRMLPDRQPTGNPVVDAVNSLHEPQVAPLDACFQMAVRRARVPAPRPNGIRQAIFGEVYWADLSKTRGSIQDILVHFFVILFSLRHVCDWAAEYPKLRQWRLRLCVLTASYFLCGPIAGIYGCILFLLGLRLAAVTFTNLVQKSPIPTDVPVFAGYVGLIVAGGCALAWSRVLQRKRILLQVVLALAFLVEAGAAALVMGTDAIDRGRMGCYIVAGLLIGVWLSWQSYEHRDSWGGTWQWPLGWIVALLLIAAGADLWSKLPSTNVFANYLEWLASWGETLFFVEAFCVFACCAVWIALRVAVWIGSSAQDTDAQKHEARATCSAANAAVGGLLLQIGLWTLSLPLLIRLATKYFPAEESDRLMRIFYGVQRFLTANVLLALAVVLVAFVVFIVRWCCANWSGLGLQERVPRMVVNWLILATMTGASIGGTALFFAWRAWHFFPWADWFVDHAIPPEAIIGVIGVILYTVPKGVRDVIHLLLDITSHFYQPDSFWPKTAAPGTIDIRACTIEQRIERRFWRAVEELFQLAHIEGLTIVAHSQGTQIAIDVLWYREANQRLKTLLHAAHPDAEPGINLVTMGSPFTHLYQYYFPARYPPLFSFASGRMDLDAHKWGNTLDRTVGPWLNLYHLDDYVGRQVNGRANDTFPQNRLIPGSGHTGYWDQQEVLNNLRPYLP